MNQRSTIIRILVGVVCMFSIFGAWAQDAERPDYERILLWEGEPPGAMGTGGDDIPFMLYCPAPTESATGTAIVVCPGGGYANLAMDHEGYQIAEWLNGHGITAFILHYRRAPYRHPVPSMDAMRAIRTVRARADSWGINANRIGILGFSAGGHLTATASVLHGGPNPDAEDPIERVSARPDFAVPCYPVISMKDPVAHAGSRQNLLGENPDLALVERLSLELQVTKDTPPMFLLHTSEDQAVSALNSVQLYAALLEHGVPAELHIFMQGKHGLGLGNKEPVLPMGAWPDLCIAWIKAIGMLPG